MRWYVSRNGETVGPVDEGQVVTWVEGGMRSGVVIPEEGQAWHPLSGSQFAAIIPKPKPDASQVQQERIAVGVIQVVWNCARTHAGVLAQKHRQLVYDDDYGQPVLDDWLDSVEYFAENVVPSAFAREYLEKYYAFRLIYPMFVALIVLRVVEQFDRAQGPRFESGYRPDMTGREYEVLVETILQRHGLQTMRTPVSGDQGVDLIAVHGATRIAIQCKRSQGAIGNGAVQEVVAGAKHYQCSMAVVVSDASFTPGARQLATTNEVFLAHHDELDDALHRALGSETGEAPGMDV